MPVVLTFAPWPDEGWVSEERPYGKIEKDASGNDFALGASLIEAHVDLGPTVSQWETQSHVRLALGSATRAVAYFLAWCKTEQPWIGAFDAPPRLMSFEITDVEEVSTRRVPREDEDLRPEGPEFGRLPGQPPLKRESIDGIAASTSIGQAPGPAPSFLADAFFATFCSFPKDLKRGLIFAAAAAEMRMVEVLRRNLLPGRESDFEGIFPPKQRARRAVKKWSGRVAKELIGRSLEEEDPDLYGRVGQLIEMRNAFLHRGELPPADDAIEGVRTARRLFEHLKDWDRDPSTQP